jgi:transcriptional regulator with XRE-family HTH domain
MFHDKLKELRQLKNLTTDEVAQNIGVSGSAYRNYERGERSPSFELLVKLADFYGVTTDYLLGRAPAPDPFADLGLDAASEQDMLAQYMSFKPEIRAMIMDVLIKLADSAKPEESTPEIVETTTIGAEHDRRASVSDAEAEETAI